MNNIIFKGNKNVFIKNFFILFIVTIFSLFVGLSPVIVDNIFILIIAWAIIPVLIWTTFTYFRYLIYSNKALEFNDQGIYYFGKFKISWSEISLVRIISQIQSSPSEKKAIGSSLAIGAFAGAAVGGAVGGGSRAIAQMAKNIEIAFVPKDPLAFINRQKGLSKSIMRFNGKLSASGEYLFLNIKPFLKADVNEIALAIQSRNIKVESL